MYYIKCKKFSITLINTKIKFRIPYKLKTKEVNRNMELSEQVKPQKSSLLTKIHKSLSKKRESGSVSSTDSGVELEYR